jgi:hypothetical protein
MKLLLSCLLMISFTAHANPKLEKILKNYKSNLFKIQSGMTQTSIEEGNELGFDPSTLEMKLVKKSSKIKSIVLRVEGKKVYFYQEKTDLKSNTKNIEVIAQNFSTKMEQMPGMKFKNIVVKKNMLHANFYGKIDNMGSSVQVSGKLIKKLKSPIFCNSTTTSAINISIPNGAEIKKFKLTTKNTSICGTKLIPEEVKKINLRNITYCDYTIEEATCTYNSDMRHLTSDI